MSKITDKEIADGMRRLWEQHSHLLSKPMKYMDEEEVQIATVMYFLLEIFEEMGCTE